MPTPEQREAGLGIKETPSVPEIPPELEKGLHVQAVNKTFTAQVKNDRGVPLIQTPPTQIITVTPLATRSTLLTWAKGSISNSITWLGMFWLRILKKALFFGWKINGQEEK